MKIIKYYLDCEIPYIGKKPFTDKSIFNDWDQWSFKYGGIIGMMSLELDTIAKTKRELKFKQIEFPNCVTIFRNFLLAPKSPFNPLIVTYNGRSFDLPIIAENMNIDEDLKLGVFKRFLQTDRDLMDFCIKRKISKKGLADTAYYFGIDIDSKYKDVPIEEFLDAFDNCFPTDGSVCTDKDEYDRCMEIVKGRNEYDVRVLPRIEEKLGILYDMRLPDDRYHKMWNDTDKKIISLMNAA